MGAGHPAAQLIANDRGGEMDRALDLLPRLLRSDLPKAYKNKLLVLCNEATGRKTVQSLDESLCYLRSLFPDSQSKVFAFLHQCLLALKWNQGELFDLLKAEADPTFELQTSYPTVQKMTEGWIAEFHKIGVAIQQTLLDYHVELIRLSLLPDELNPAESDSEMFHAMFSRLLLKTDSPSKTASIIYSVLKLCCCTDKNVPELEPYLIPNFDLCRSYPNIWLKLRIAEFLCNLGEQKCLIAMMAYSQQYMKGEKIDQYSPLQFIRILFERDVATIVNLNQLAAWFDKKNYFQDPLKGITYNKCEIKSSILLGICNERDNQHLSKPYYIGIVNHILNENLALMFYWLHMSIRLYCEMSDVIYDPKASSRRW